MEGTALGAGEAVNPEQALKMAAAGLLQLPKWH
jgi:hypothetical protein